jgi:hypothetical protein
MQSAAQLDIQFRGPGGELYSILTVHDRLSFAFCFTKHAYIAFRENSLFDPGSSLPFFLGPGNFLLLFLIHKFWLVSYLVLPQFC